ncbi:uncharacterized protein UTRI_01886_B [Ustilago trichophora]|uniref:Mitochondrial PGP phosphatase-domain-containing protein n=1 Tax=Ustilago trichophora TaxID=86804 RepID=A0A5C3DUK3_9BASI|nr:uncharacterized protein UTRI_01886_B [Ustilago trichophora]
MGNISGVVAILAVIFRPSLVVPHVQVPDIRHLDWEALHANGARFLVFDKDNCLTAPHSDVLEPAITDAWEQCQRVFGRENILIVSNSSGSSDDPSGLGAESLSRALNVPVLCHKQKKPSHGCAAEALEYFVALSHDRDTTIAQAKQMPPGSGAIEAGPSRQTRKYLRERRKVLRTQVPVDESGSGSILLVGDRTMTDVVVAHRMNDELSRRRRKLGLDAICDGSTSASASVPPPQCISVLTTGIWTYEGRLNALMRNLETRVTSYLISKGFRPGQPGLLSFGRSAHDPSPDWQKIAATPFTNPQAVVSRLSREDAAQFAYTGDRVPAASPTEPTLGAILIAAIVRPLPPRIASLITSLLYSRPLVWISSNLRDGWNVMIKGLEFGVREAGIQPHAARSNRKLVYTSEPSSSIASTTPNAFQAYDIEEEVAPKSKAETKKDAVSASLSDYLESRLPSSFPAIGAASQLRTRLDQPSSFSAQTFLTRLTFSLPKPASSSSNLAQRTLHTSAVRFNQPRPSPSSGSRPRLPKRNWIAAFSALVIVPASYYAGMRLHDLKDAKAIDPSQPLPFTPASPSPELHQHPAKPPAIVFDERDEKVKKALLKAQLDKKRELELTLFHLVREREEVLDKLERVHQRRLESE